MGEAVEDSGLRRMEAFAKGSTTLAFPRSETGVGKELRVSVGDVKSGNRGEETSDEVRDVSERADSEGCG